MFRSKKIADMDEDQQVDTLKEILRDHGVPTRALGKKDAQEHKDRIAQVLCCRLCWFTLFCCSSKTISFSFPHNPTCFHLRFRVLPHLHPISNLIPPLPPQEKEVAELDTSLIVEGPRRTRSRIVDFKQLLGSDSEDESGEGEENGDGEEGALRVRVCD